jgi:hypothetical protein
MPAHTPDHAEANLPWQDEISAGWMLTGDESDRKIQP